MAQSKSNLKRLEIMKTRAKKKRKHKHRWSEPRWNGYSVVPGLFGQTHPDKNSFRRYCKCGEAK